jgi:hypothetical protein
MKKIILVLILILSNSPLWAASSGTSEYIKPKETQGPARKGMGFDFNLDIGIAPVIPTLASPTFGARVSARADAGLLIAREPAYFGVGLTGGRLPTETWGLGPYVSVAHLWTGVWGSLAFLMNDRAQPVGSLSAGWSIFGAEGQVFPGGATFIVKLRIPIGLPIWAITHDQTTRTHRSRN